MGTTTLNIDLGIMDNIPKIFHEVFNLSIKIDGSSMSPILVFTRKDDIKEVYKFKMSSTIDIKDDRWNKMITELTVIVRDIKVDKILKK